MRSPVWGSVGGVEDTTRATGRGVVMVRGEEGGGEEDRKERGREREKEGTLSAARLYSIYGISGNKILGFVTS